MEIRKKDKLKFSLATPKEVTRTFLRIWDPTNGVVPTSRRILEDVKRVLDSLAKIVEAKGQIVPGLVNRNGHRAPRSKCMHKLPGKKNTLSEMGVHQSIRGVVLDGYRKEKNLFLEKMKPRKNPMGLLKKKIALTKPRRN